MLPDKVYDWLKWIALIALNAIGVCYSALAGVWGWPFGDEIAKTCAALALLIGTLIGISTATYNRANSIK